jgi:hypothetical protein
MWLLGLNTVDELRPIANIQAAVKQSTEGL